jgi:hypothetical protein
MRRAIATAALIAASALPAASRAQALREFCPDRPGLGTPACTVDRGRLVLEAGVMDWSSDRKPSTRTDTLIAGDILLRYGITGTLEAQVGWSALGHVRARPGGSARGSSGSGDVLLALRRNLRNPDGTGFSLALMPQLTLPTGGAVMGAGDWGAGLLLPASRELPGGFALAFTGSVEAAVDEDRDGRHLALGAIVGLDVPLSDRLGATVELSARRDADPSGVSSTWLAGLSAGWSPGESLQFDAGANIGLNAAAPDVQLYLGMACRF